MEEARQDRYFVLVTSGLEFIAADELRRNSSISQIEYQSGSGVISFAAQATLRAEMFDTVEGLFIIAHQGTHEGLKSYDKDQALLFFGQLPFTIDLNCWIRCLDKWSEIFGLPRPPTDCLNPAFDLSNREPKTSDDKSAVRFRCSCLREGTHGWDSVFAAGVLGAGLIQRFGWPVSLKQYQLEIYLQVIEDDFVVGVSLGAKPPWDESCSTSSSHRMGKAKRRRMKGQVEELGQTSLSPLVANSLRQYANLKGGEVVLDPFCGIGTIPIHVASYYPHIISLGADLDAKCVEKSMTNVERWKSSKKNEGLAVSPVEILWWNAWSIPMRDASVDVIISDLPFGIRSGSMRSLPKLYPRALKELARITRIDGKGYFITAQMELMTALLTKNFSRVWRLDNIFPFKMCNLAVNLYEITRIGQSAIVEEDVGVEDTEDGEEEVRSRTGRKSKQPDQKKARRKSKETVTEKSG